MKTIVLLLIRLYQKTAFIRKPIQRTIFGNEGSCRFNPTCSEYTIQSINKFGVGKGLWLGFKRITRCNPLFSK